MKLTSEQRDDLLLAIANKLGIIEVPEVGQNGVQSKKSRTRKPYPEAIGIYEGLEKIAKMPDEIEMIDLAGAVEVKRDTLIVYGNSVGVKSAGRKISKEEAAKLWRTYCAKRGW